MAEPNVVKNDPPNAFKIPSVPKKQMYLAGEVDPELASRLRPNGVLQKTVDLAEVHANLSPETPAGARIWSMQFTPENLSALAGLNITDYLNYRIRYSIHVKGAAETATQSGALGVVYLQDPSMTLPVGDTAVFQQATKMQSYGMVNSREGVIFENFWGSEDNMSPKKFTQPLGNPRMSQLGQIYVFCHTRPPTHAQGMFILKPRMDIFLTDKWPTVNVLTDMQYFNADQATGPWLMMKLEGMFFPLIACQLNPAVPGGHWMVQNQPWTLSIRWSDEDADHPQTGTMRVTLSAGASMLITKPDGQRVQAAVFPMPKFQKYAVESIVVENFVATNFKVEPEGNVETDSFDLLTNTPVIPRIPRIVTFADVKKNLSDHIDVEERWLIVGRPNRR